MASGHVVRRQMGRDKDKISRTGWNWNRRQGKVCPHPICGVIITDAATTCAQHRRWYERVYKDANFYARLIHRQADLALEAGVPCVVVLLYTKRWHIKHAPKESIKAQIQELIYGYRNA